MVRVAHLSDTHLGTRIREGVKQQVWAKEMQILLLENDFYERFIEIFERIKNEDPPIDVVIHSGDLYDTPTAHNPSQPPVKAQETAINVLRDFIDETSIPVVIIEGNHGLYRQLDVSLLDVLKSSIPEINVATQVDLKRALVNDEPLKFEFDGFEVFCFPFIEPDLLEKGDLRQVFDEWVLTKQSPSSKIPSIAVAHGMALDNTLFPIIETMNYDYIALGHDHHQHQYLANAWYAGAPERWRFDEAAHKKGFLIVDVKAGKKPEVSQEIIEFRRPVFNEKIKIDQDETVESLLEKVRTWFDAKGLKTGWDPETAARVRLIFEGSSAGIGPLSLNIGLEGLRAEILGKDSDYNIVQFVWPLKKLGSEFTTSAYEEIVSEFLIDEPESDFKEFLEHWKLDERYDPDTLARIAARALEIAARGMNAKMTVEDLEGDDE